MGNGATIQLAAGTAAGTNLDLPPGTPGTAGDLALLYAAGFMAALLLAAFLIRWLRGRAAGLRLLHLPRHAGPDDGAVAVVGGLGVMLAVATTVVAGAWASRFLQAYQAQVAELLPVLLGALAICVLGLWDDVFELSAGRKALFQVLAAAAVFAAGLRVDSFRLPGLGLIELEWWLSLPVTLLWFVGITNAFNLVDGADGVAGGAALMATIAMFVVALVVGQPLTALLLAVTGGAVLAFLHFNFPPATVYLGDAGSMSLGFLLAGVGLQASSKATTALAIAIPVVSLGLPILDTALAILRRLLRGEGVTRRDLGHIHHRLQSLGHSPRKVALLVYAACATLALASLILLAPDMRVVGLAFLIVGAATFLGLQRLRIPELMELRRSLSRGMHQPATIAYRVAVHEAVRAAAAPSETRARTEVVDALLRIANVFEAELYLTSVEGGPNPRSDTPHWTWSQSEVRISRDYRSIYWDVFLPVTMPATDTVGTLRLRQHSSNHVPSEFAFLATALVPQMVHLLVPPHPILHDQVDRAVG